MTVGKTIKIHLKEGSSNSLFIAEMFNWTGKVIVVPRAQLLKLSERDDVKQTGLYILAGQELYERRIKECAYIGESANVWTQLNQHNDDPDKDFWDQTFIIVSKDNNLTQAHTRYLESCLAELVHRNGKATLTNDTHPPLPQLSESDTDDIHYFLEQIKILLPVLGFPFVSTVASSEPPVQTLPLAKPLEQTSSSAEPLKTQQWTQLPKPTPKVYYQLVNRNSGKVLSIANESTSDGAKAVQYDNHQGTNQQWQIVDTDDGYYRLINRNSDQVLEVLYSSTSNGGTVDQWSNNGSPTQQWKLISKDNGYYTLVNRNSGLLADVFGASTENSAEIIQQTGSGDASQQWSLSSV
jgi:hypothetical protein